MLISYIFFTLTIHYDFLGCLHFCSNLFQICVHFRTIQKQVPPSQHILKSAPDLFAGLNMSRVQPASLPWQIFPLRRGKEQEMNVIIIYLWPISLIIIGTQKAYVMVNSNDLRIILYIMKDRFMPRG